MTCFLKCRWYRRRYAPCGSGSYSWLWTETWGLSWMLRHICKYWLEFSEWQLHLTVPDKSIRSFAQMFGSVNYWLSKFHPGYHQSSEGQFLIWSNIGVVIVTSSLTYFANVSTSSFRAFSAPWATPIEATKLQAPCGSQDKFITMCDLETVSLSALLDTLGPDNLLSIYSRSDNLGSVSHKSPALGLGHTVSSIGIADVHSIRPEMLNDPDTILRCGGFCGLHFISRHLNCLCHIGLQK